MTGIAPRIRRAWTRSAAGCRRLTLVLPALLAMAAPGLAQNGPPDLGQMSIEDLMKVEITSASRREQPAQDVAAAVFVITHDDIRRSGMTTIPDLLRLAPGVDVAQINSNQWAVSARGFNDAQADMLLVLVDGRSVYNRVSSGVFWDTEDLMLDDVERIEVIRGPGAALWGANAVNGVINIITRTAADTRGGLVRVDAGRFGEQAAVRYGGTLGAARYRLYSQWTRRDQSIIAPGTRANDGSHSVTTGFRADWATQPGAVTFEGNVTAGQVRALLPNLNPLTAAREPIANDPSNVQEGSLLGRWTHTRAGGASLQIQSSLDIAGRQEPLADYNRHVFDIGTLYHTALGARQDLVAGAGYRFITERLVGHVGFSLTPAISDATLVTAFISDQIALFGNRMAVTLGSQVQHDSDMGAGVQPTARVMWKGLPHQRLWAATSRALRTPSLFERGLRVDFPPVPDAGGTPLVVTQLGNPAATTETLVDVEAGYRLEIGNRAAIDVTGFAVRNDHTETQEQSAPVVQLVPTPQTLVTSRHGNLLTVTTRGVEVASHWMPVPAWRFDGSYTTFRFTPHPAAASQDPAAATEDGNAPRTQWQVRSAFSPGTRATVNVGVFHVGALEELAVDAYTRADVSAEWRFNSRLSATAIGQNLFAAAHAEFASEGLSPLATQVPRSASVHLIWRSRP